MTGTASPPPERNPLEEALENYQTMKQELQHARKRAAEAEGKCAALSAECAMLRSSLDSMTKNFLRVQAYANELTTRLDVVRETITAAQRGALQFAARSTDKLSIEPETAEEQQDAESVRSILDRLHPGHNEPFPEPLSRA